MRKHKVHTVIHKDIEIFKGREVSFEAQYDYCIFKDTFIESETKINKNSLAMKNTYQKLLEEEK